MLILENEQYRICVKEIGAELCSFFEKTTQREFMWQPCDEIWNHSSLILFPNPGRICRCRTIIGGRVYQGYMHGFAYKKRFSVVAHTSTLLIMELYSDDETRASFPYEFTLRVVYRLTDEKLIQEFHVLNHGDKKMYFCLGAHPGFYFPINLGESGNDYVLRFDTPQQIDRLIPHSETMLLTHEKYRFLNNETDIPLSENYFNDGAVLLENVHAESITLMSLKSKCFIKLEIKGFPFMCLWGNKHRNAMICVEPWCGVSDYIDTDHIWETKYGIESIFPSEEFCREIKISVG